MVKKQIDGRRSREQRIGVISDTHGLLRPEAVEALDGADLILHAGDIGRPEVLEGLRAIAPVVAVRGNNDRDSWARRFPETQLVRAGEVRIYLLHDVKDMRTKPPGENIQVVVSGHSHRPSIERRDAILFLNPGSAGPRRFRLPVSVGLLFVRGAGVRAELLDLSSQISIR